MTGFHKRSDLKSSNVVREECHVLPYVLASAECTRLL